jgi:hypothetical protein
VSIYINHKIHDETDTIDDNSTAQKPPGENEYAEVSSADQKSKKLREKLGNYVLSLGAGEGFGEVALVSNDTRSASIIADEVTHLMVVNKALYTRLGFFKWNSLAISILYVTDFLAFFLRCLQAPTLRKLREKQSFINSSPFFGNWAPKMKKLLSLCLEREIIPYDSYLGKQGEAANKMFFLIRHKMDFLFIHLITIDVFIHFEFVSFASQWSSQNNSEPNLSSSTISASLSTKASRECQ